jgi:cell division protease FtsH
VTSGAANDLDRATKTARQMVTELGMSDRLGLVKLGRKREEIFLGRDISEDRDYSEEVAYAIDQEVKAIIDSCYAKAREIIAENRSLLDKIAAILLERETLDGQEFEALVNGEELPEKPEKNGEESEKSENVSESVPGAKASDEGAPERPNENTGTSKNEFLA